MRPPVLPLRPRHRPGPAGLAVALGLVAAASGAALLWPHPPPMVPPAPGVGPIVFLGDSITSGHGLPLPATFPHRIGASLGLPAVNAGVSGDTTADGLARLDRDVLAHRPRLVVVELGVNDVFRTRPRERTLDDLGTIVRRVRALGIPLVLIHIRLPRVAGDGYREDVRALARAEGAVVVEDFLDGIVPDLTTDGLHPDAEGHARLAERLLPVVRDALAR